MSILNIDELCELATTAGEIMKKSFRDNVLHGSVGIEKKSDRSWVTKTDLDINEFILSQLADRYPQLDIIAEEGSRRRANADYTLMCDPVDGTTAFANGHAVANICIALLYQGQPVASVVYEPLGFLSRMYVAEQGSGAYLYINGEAQKLAVSSIDRLEEAHIVMSWFHGSKYNLSQFWEYCVEMGISHHEAIAFGSFGARVAEGPTTASVYAGTSGLEVAALAPLILEAGGTVTDIQGRELIFDQAGEVDGHVMSNGLVHDQLIRQLQWYR